MTAVVESPTDGPSAPQQGMEPVACAVPGGTRVPVVVEGVGGAGTVLLSGPVEGHGPEFLLAHVGRWGALPDLGATQVRGLLDASGLDGRGGGGFALGRKVSAALARGVTPAWWSMQGRASRRAARTAHSAVFDRTWYWTGPPSWRGRWVSRRSWSTSTGRLDLRRFRWPLPQPSRSSRAGRARQVRASTSASLRTS